MKKILHILFFLLVAFTGKSQLTLTRPTTGDIWPAYSTQRIEWTSSNIDNIMIESSLDSGRTWSVIVSSYPASAQYFPWDIPNKISDSCYIRISDVLNSSTSSYNKGKPFKIPSPSIKVDSLIATATAKTVFPITWVSSGIKRVSIYASFNNKISFIKIADSVSAYNFYYNWIVPDSIGLNCFIRIVNAEDSFVVDTSSTSIQITGLLVGTNNKFKGGSFDGHAVANNQIKRVTLIAPNKVDSLFGSSVYTIQWKQNNIDQVNLKFSPDNGVNWQTIINAYPATANKYDWIVPNSPTGIALIKIEDFSDSTVFDKSDTNFVIRTKLLKISQPDSTTIFYKQTALPISWTSGGISFIKAYTLVGNEMKLIADSIPSNYESINKILSALLSDSFRIVLADVSDSSMRDTSALLIAKKLANADKAKYHGGAFDGHTVASNGKKSLKLISPIGGEKFSVINKYDIKWKSENIERISIDFSSDSGKLWTKIDSGITATSNTYSWKTPNTPSSKCLVRIRNDYDTSLQSISDSVFTLTSKKIVNNTDSLNWVKGTSKSIEWLALGVETIKVSFKNASQQNWIIIKDSINAAFETINWILPNNLTDSIWIQIADVKDSIVKTENLYKGQLTALNTNFSTTKFHGGSFDGHSQRSNLNKLIVKRPYENEVLFGGATYTIKWSTVNFEDSVLLQYSIDSGATWVSITKTMASLGLYDWNIPLSFSVIGVVHNTYSINSKINLPTTIVTTNINSNKCLLRALNISDGNSLIGISAKPFTILTTAAPNKNDLIFPIIRDTIYSQNLFIKLKATNTKNKPVNYAIISGSANLINDSIAINKPGSVTVVAVTPGDSTHLASDSIYQQFCIYPLRPTIIVNGKTSICSGDSSVLMSSIILNNQWYIDSIKIIGATDSLIKIKSAGKYSLTTIIEGCASALSVPVPITFNDIPTIPVISNNRPLVFSPNDSTILTSSIASGNQWIMNGTPIALATGQNYTAKTSGVYSVKVVNASGCSATSLTVTVSAILGPVVITPVISNNRPLGFCEGDSTILSSSIVYGNHWFVDGVQLISDTAQTIIVKTSGTYTVVNKTISSKGIQVLVIAFPTKPIIANVGSLSFLQGDSTSLVSSSVQGNQWFFNAVLIVGANAQNFIAKQSGDYIVQAVNSFGCATSSNVVTVVVNAIPLPLITTNDSLVFCFGNSAVLTSSMPTGNQWMKDGVVMNGEINKNLVVKITGDYIVTNKVNGITIKSNPTSVLVNPIPEKPIITSNFLRVMVSSAASGNQWYIDTITAIFGETNTSFKPTTPGWYAVKVTDNGCIGLFSDKFNYQDRATIIMDSVISIYPNPAHNTFVITFNTALSDRVNIEVLDFNGKLIVSKSNIKDKDQVDISTLTPGIYTVSIYDGFGKIISSSKILKL